jgi:energy-coupling factor transport system permease protein
MDLLKTLPIGLYLEEPETWMHRLDARVKLAWLVSLLVTPILANPWWRFGVVATLILLTISALIPLRVWRQQMGVLLFLCSIMLVLTLVLPDGLAIGHQPRLPTADDIQRITPGPFSGELTQLTAKYLSIENGIDPSPDPFGEALLQPPPTSYRYVLVDQGPLKITQQSLELGIRLSTLFFTLIYGTNLFLLTTAPEEITVALEALMKPLRWFKLPVTEIVLTVTLSLRFIPLVLEEIQNLIRSVQTRAINWKKLGIRGAAQVWLAVMERLLKNLLLRAEQTAAAMQVRGFSTPSTHRVHWYELRFRGWDWFAWGLLLVGWWARLTWGGEA